MFISRIAPALRGVRDCDVFVPNTLDWSLSLIPFLLVFFLDFLVFFAFAIFLAFGGRFLPFSPGVTLKGEARNIAKGQKQSGHFWGRSEELLWNLLPDHLFLAFFLDALPCFAGGCLVAPSTGLNAVLSLLQPLDRYRAPSAIGSAIGRPLPRPISHPRTGRSPQPPRSCVK